MNTKIMTIILASCFTASVSFADEPEIRDDVVEQCQAYAEATGDETSDCDCYGKLAAADDDLAAELLLLQTEEDVANASEAVLAAAMQCNIPETEE